jgi:hypothetical protein
MVCLQLSVCFSKGFFVDIWEEKAGVGEVPVDETQGFVIPGQVED